MAAAILEKLAGLTSSKRLSGTVAVFLQYPAFNDAAVIGEADVIDVRIDGEVLFRARGDLARHVFRNRRRRGAEPVGWLPSGWTQPALAGLAVLAGGGGAL